MFGLFWCLGYQFSPRLAEMKETRFWRIDPAANYGLLNGLARHRINTRLIANNWDDILRVAGSLKVGTVRASTLIQALQRGGRPTMLARAISELGRIAKTLYLLNYIDDIHYRRRIQTLRWNQNMLPRAGFGLGVGLADDSKRLPARRRLRGRIEDVAFIWHRWWRDIFVLLNEFVQGIPIPLCDSPFFLGEVWNFLQQVQDPVSRSDELGQFRPNMHWALDAGHPVWTGSPCWIATEGAISQIIKNGRFPLHRGARINQHLDEA